MKRKYWPQWNEWKWILYFRGWTNEGSRHMQFSWLVLVFDKTASLHTAHPTNPVNNKMALHLVQRHFRQIDDACSSYVNLDAMSSCWNRQPFLHRVLSFIYLRSMWRKFWTKLYGTHCRFLTQFWTPISYIEPKHNDK